MARWRSGSEARLAEAALDLFIDQGYEQTTVSEIAGRAGLTERTFYRYFADKREVLFGGRDGLERELVHVIAGLPASIAPLDAIAVALDHVATHYFADRGPVALKRQAVIEANPDLQERELLKMASLAAAIGRTLHDRGVSEPAASLAAEAGVAVFRIAFSQWVAPGNERALSDLIRSTLADLRTVTGGT